MDYCARGEHTEWEVRHKLDKFKLSEEEEDSVIKELLSEKFLDPERYAKTFSKDKFLLNQWGKIKIRKALEQKRLDEASIQKGLQAIDSGAYKDQLKKHLKTKLKTIKDKNIFIRKGKLFRYAAQKGFETDLIYKFIDELMEKNSDP